MVVFPGSAQLFLIGKKYQDTYTVHAGHVGSSVICRMGRMFRGNTAGHHTDSRPYNMDSCIARIGDGRELYSPVVTVDHHSMLAVAPSSLRVPMSRAVDCPQSGQFRSPR
jgi:hypothetical protein